MVILFGFASVYTPPITLFSGAETSYDRYYYSKLPVLLMQINALYDIEAQPKRSYR